jgi:hypothetical protein
MHSQPARFCPNPWSAFLCGRAEDDLPPGLEDAISKSDVNAVTTLVAKRGSGHGYSVLPLRAAMFVAIDVGNLEIVKILAGGGGFCARHVNRNGMTHIDEACRQGKEAIVDYLLGQLESWDRITDEDDSTSGRQTCLMHAAQNGHLGCVRRLLLEGAEKIAINSNRGGGRTALQYAMEGGHVDVVRELLLKGGARLLSRDQITAVGAANLNGSLGCVQVHEVRGCGRIAAASFSMTGPFQLV